MLLIAKVSSRFSQVMNVWVKVTLVKDMMKPDRLLILYAI